MSLVARVTGWALALGAAIVTAAAASGASASPSAGRGSRFRAALLARAREDLGVVEDPKLGKNRGREVDQYLANVHQAPGQAWCAAGVWTWIRDAARRVGAESVLVVIPATGSAKALADGPKRQRPSWWLDAGAVRSGSWRPPAGSLAIWDRSNPPGSSWQGHVGVVDTWTGPSSDAWTSVEPNSGIAGDRVAVMDRALSDPRLLGFVVFPESF